MAKKADPAFLESWNKIVENLDETIKHAMKERDASTIGGVIADAMRHEKDLEIMAGRTRSSKKLGEITDLSRRFITLITTARESLDTMVKNCK
jgi:hypothetical protein